MSSEYRTKLIRRAVDANTSPNVAATPIQARTLHKFFESPQCADIAYLKIIERGEWAVSGLTQPNATIGHHHSGSYGGTFRANSLNGNDTVRSALDVSGSGGTVSGAALGKIGAFNATSSKSPGVGDGGDKVLAKCVRLMKTYLLVYYPSDPVLVSIDRFCYRMQSIYEDASKSFEYVRALVDTISQSRHNPYHITSTSVPPSNGSVITIATPTSANSNPGSSNTLSPFPASGASTAPSSTTFGGHLSTTLDTSTLTANSGAFDGRSNSTGVSGTLASHAGNSGINGGVGANSSLAASGTAAAGNNASSNSSNHPNAAGNGKLHASSTTHGAAGNASHATDSHATSPSTSRRATVALPNPSAGLPASLAHLLASIHIVPKEPLVANYLAARTRLPPTPDILESLVCSSIFGGRIPKPLLDLLAERNTTHSTVSKSMGTLTNSGGGGSGNSSTMSASRMARSHHDGTVSSSMTGGSGSSQASGSSGALIPHTTSSSNLNKMSSANHALRGFLFSLHDQDLKERIATVSSSKKQEERALYRSFRRGQPLFQYKHYNEQVKLELSESQIDAIVTAMIQSTNHESRLLASKIMIKLIMDMYCHDPVEVASAALLSILLEMVHPDQPVDTKIHSFNLVFNISTHLHMFEDVAFFGPPPTTNPNSPRSQSNDPFKGTTPTIYRIQTELFAVVKEMLLILVQQGEASRKLWFSGLSCLMYFMADAGQIDREKLQGLDPRVIAAFFKNLDYINDSVWRHLVRILVNRLYLDSPRSGKKAAVPSHDFISQVMLLGQKYETPEVKDNRDNITPSSNKEGIRFVIELYKRSRSIEARDNLFIVIFDYIHFCYRRMVRSNPAVAKDTPQAAGGAGLSQSRPSKLNVPTAKPASDTTRSPKDQGTPNGANKTPTSAQFSVILDILTRIDAPQYFACIFKYPPPNFVNHVLGLISHVSNTSHNNEMSSLLSQADPIILRRVLKDFAALADLTLRFAPSFAEDCVVLLSETSNAALLSASLKSITALVQGKASSALIASSGVAPHLFQYERLQGAQWMQQLLQLVWNVRLGLAQVPPVEVKKTVGPVLHSDTATTTVRSRPRKESGGSITASSATTASTTADSSQAQHVPIARRLSDTKSTDSRRTSKDSREHREVKPEKELKEVKEVREKEHSYSGSRDAKDTTRDHHHASHHAHKDKERDHKDAKEKEKTTEHSHKEPKDHKETKEPHKELHKEHRDKEHKDHIDSKHSSAGSSGRHHHHGSVPKIQPVNLSLIPPTTLTEMPSHMLPTRGLHLRSADTNFIDTVEASFSAFAKSSDPLVRRSYLRIVEAGMYYIVSLSDQGASASHRRSTSPSTPHTPTAEPSTSPLPSPSGASPAPLSPLSPQATNSGTGRSPRTTGSLLLDAEALTRKAFELLNSSFLKLIKVGQESTEANLQLMFDIIVEFVTFVPSANRSDTYKSLMRFSPPPAGFAASPSAAMSASSSAGNLGPSATVSANGEDTKRGSTSPLKDKLGAPNNVSGSSSHPHLSPRGSRNLSADPHATSPHPPMVKTPRGTSADSVLAALQYNLSDSDESSDDLSFGNPSTNMGASGVSSNALNGMSGAASGAAGTALDLHSPPSPQLERLSHGPSVPESSSRAIDMMDLNSQDDSPAGLFMRGLTDMVRPLLELVHIDILLHLFSNMPPRMNSTTRPVVLYFLTERCKRSSSDLDVVGGSSFFKKLLTENDPLISYLASRFLIDKLQKEQPENFNMVVNTLLAKAVDLNDEKLVSNPYLQIKAIFEMNTTLRRKEHGAIFPL